MSNRHSDKPAGQPRPPKEFAPVTNPVVKPSLDESGFNNKFATLKVDAEDVDDHDDDDYEGDEEHQQNQSVEA